MKTTAAVLVETGKPLELAELEIPPLQSGQALVEIAFSGVCHTQLLECGGLRGKDLFLPHCLGHEGSGSVLDIGDSEPDRDYARYCRMVASDELKVGPLLEARYRL